MTGIVVNTIIKTTEIYVTPTFAQPRVVRVGAKITDAFLGREQEIHLIALLAKTIADYPNDPVLLRIEEESKEQS